MINLRETINENSMTAVYFNSDSCGACNIIKNKIAEILINYPKIKFIELKGEENIKLSYEHNVYSFPVFLLFIDGRETIREGKYVDLLKLQSYIERYYNLYY